ncbi:MAG: putative lipid II flippase FtsW [Bacillota bacterium]
MRGRLGKAKPRSRRAPDLILLFTVVILVAFGVLMVLSSSGYSARVRFDDSLHYFKRQAVWAVGGLLLMLFLQQRVDYWIYRRYARLCIVMAVVLLALSLIPGIGVEARGSQRSILVGPISVSPAELVKLCLVIYLAHSFCRVPEKMRRFFVGVVPHLAVVALVVGLVMLQPDLGTAVTIAGTVFIMLYIAGAHPGHLFGLVVVGVPAVLALILSEPYRRRRFFAFLNPWVDPLDSGFHIIQSLYALGSGRVFGVGLGASHQKYLYLPEQHTDFIFAIVGEELGLVGCIVVLGLFCVLAWRAFRVAACAPDSFAGLLAAGIAVMVLLQVVINIGVVTSVLPVTGIPLPLISYGGSSLLVTMGAMGILLNISRYSRV